MWHLDIMSLNQGPFSALSLPPPPAFFHAIDLLQKLGQLSCRMSHILDVSVLLWCHYLVPLSPEFPETGN